MRNNSFGYGDFSKERSRSFVRSIARGISLLQALADAGRPLSLSELAKSMGTNNATTSRICYTLTQLGFIARNINRRYQLTPRVLSLGYATICGLNWREVARYHVERLSAEIGETVNLCVLDGKEILYIIRITTEKLLPYDLLIGSKLPVHCTSMGKVLMAFAPPDVRSRILPALNFPPITHRTITRLEDYVQELEKVRQRGYAINDEEQVIGLRSVAAPIRDSQGWAMAAINIAVPTKRYSRSDVEKVLAPRAIETAEAISKNLREMGVEWKDVSGEETPHYHSPRYMVEERTVNRNRK